MKFAKQPGFLLVDALFAVLVTALCIFTLNNLLMCIKSSEKINHHSNEIVFSYVQFNNFLHDGKAVYTEPDKGNFKKCVFTKIDKSGGEKTYRIEQYQDMIRVTSTNGGHMPLILHIRAAQFKTEENKILIRVTEHDNRKSDLLFVLDKKKAKEKKHEAKT